MKRLLVILLACGACLAHAQGVHRCVDEQGRRMYVDRACQHLGLRAETAPEALPEPVQAMPDLEVDAGSVAAAEGCPGPTPELLRDRVEEAFSKRDLNALSGMYHWGGAGRRSASAVVEHLQHLISTAPQAVILRRGADSDDWLWAGLPPPSEAAPPELVLLADAQADVPLARFRLGRQAGCYWLSY